MNPSLMDSPVTLIIKAPSQKYDDQTIDCFLDWTVEKLKHHLSKVYPSKPSLKDQRLVYSGKLLLDHLQLKDVLRKQDDYHMVHLVCSTLTPPNSPKSNTRRESTGSSGANINSNLEHTNSTATSSASENQHPTTPDLRQRTVPLVQSSPAERPPMHYFTQWHVNNQIPPQQIPAAYPQYPLIGPFHLLWWQQLYARQYYMQYHAATVSAQASASDEHTLPTSRIPLHSEHAQNPHAAAPNLAPQENRAVNQNVQMNAQGGPVMNEEDFNRDWLDWMYTFTRATILFSIVYFYSSFSRFVMMMGAMLLVYLHQARWFPFRQDGDQQPVDNPDANVNNDLQNINHAELREMERLMDNGIGDETVEDAAQDIHTEHQPGILASAWTFITAFFISLIPEGPPAAPN